MSKDLAGKEQIYRGELIDGIRSYARAEGIELTTKQAETALNGLIETIKEALARGISVKLIGFGAFEVRHRPARDSWDMIKERMVKLEPKNYVYFNCGGDLESKIQSIPFKLQEKENGKSKWVIDRNA